MNNNKLIAILFFPLFTSCKKDKVETTYVPTYLKQMLPYTNGQSIRFIGSNGGIIEANISVTSGFVEKSNCASCEIYAREEYINYYFKVGIHPFAQFSADIRPIIFMSIFSPQDNYQIGGGFDFLIAEGMAQPICNGPRQMCLSNIVLNGQTYNNVLEVISGATGSNQLTKAYYTVTQGLIGFRYGNGFTFTRL